MNRLLSTPDPELTLIEAIEVELNARRAASDQGRPYHYWRARGDSAPPPEEHWCDTCAGFYGVPHDMAHSAILCRQIDRDWGCACIDCVVHDAWKRAGGTVRFGQSEKVAQAAALKARRKAIRDALGRIVGRGGRDEPLVSMRLSQAEALIEMARGQQTQDGAR